MNKRVLLAGLFHETNTFVEQTTSLADFQIQRGEEMLRCAGDSSPLGGVIEAASRFGWTILPTVDFRASPGGVVEDEVVETFLRELRDSAQSHVAARVDGIFLVLHGAMVSQSQLDVEGEILERIRSWPGLAGVPIFGVFDLHANFTQRMADHSNCLVAYHENPHTDARPTAQFAAALLEKSFKTGKVPRTYWTHPPIMWPPTGTGTAHEPMLSLEKLARRIESENEEMWSVNVMAGFSFADTPETGVSFSIATVGPESEARAKLEQLHQVALKNKERGNVLDTPIESLIPQILSANRTPSSHPSPPVGEKVPEGRMRGISNGSWHRFASNPWRFSLSTNLPASSDLPREEQNLEPTALTVIVEPSDNIGAGAPGDGTGALRSLIAHRATNAAVAIQDPEAVRRLTQVPLGIQVTLSIGGKGSALDAGPIELAVVLISRSNGQFQLEDRQSHLASMCGDSFGMGPCAVVRHEGILILLTSRRTPPFDLGQWRSQGIRPEELSVIVVKAAVAHRRAYDPIAARMFWVGTPGPCSSDLKALPYRRVRRPIFPLDN